MGFFNFNSGDIFESKDTILKSTDNIKIKTLYNFNFVTKQEDKQIKSVMKFVKYNYSITSRAIAMIYEFSKLKAKLSFIYPEIIIIKYRSSKNPLDLLAVAMAYSKKASFYRPMAIEYYNTYFNNPLKIPTNTLGVPLFDEWYLHRQLAALYDEEGLYYKSVNEIKKCIIINNGKRADEFIRIGDTLLKINTKEAEEYYKTLMKTDTYYRYKSQIDEAYESVRLKIVQNFTYHSDIIKERPDETDEQIRLLAVNYINII